jgi:bifunctional enzyme CysN/CysC
LHRSDAESLKLNEIGRIKITSACPLFFDPYDRNRATGGFVLIDPNDFRTVGAGMIRHSSRSTITEIKRESREKVAQALPPSSEMHWTPGMVALTDRISRQKHQPLCVWLCGGEPVTRNGIAALLEKQLFDTGLQVIRLTDENTRSGLNADLRLNVPDAQEGARRHMHLARLFTDFGHLVICAYPDTTAETIRDIRQRFVQQQLLIVSLDSKPPIGDIVIDAGAADSAVTAATLFDHVIKRVSTA